MFLVGHFRDESYKELFQSTFQEKGISFEIKQDPNENAFFLLVIDQENLEEAQKIYLEVMGLAPPKPIEIPEEWLRLKALRLLPVGKFCVFFSIFCFICLLMPSLRGFVDLLYFSNSQTEFIPEIQRGEIWRILTPIFLHFSIFHILFNCLWMKDLSKIFENTLGSRNFFFLILCIGVISNFAQYAVLGPKFGGLSGVVYGLLGYLWVKRSLDPEYPFGLPKRDIMLMIGWFVLCLTGILGPIANTAHGVGLALGMIVALFSNESETKQYIKWVGVIVLILAVTYFTESLGLSRQGQFFFIKSVL